MKQVLILFLSLSVFGFCRAQDTLVASNGKQWPGSSGRFAPGALEFVTAKKGARLFKAEKIAYIKRRGQRHYPFNTIHRYNGKSIVFSDIRKDDLFLYYKPLNGKKEKKINTNRVFSYHDKGEEVMVFKESIYNGDTLTNERVRSLMEGRQDARLYYKNPWTGLAAFGIGFASGYFLNYWGVFVPAAYAGVYSAINPLKSKRKIRILGQRYVTDDYYRFGFNSRAKITKLQWSAGGGLLGLGAGVGLLEYLKSLEK